ncbi:MAG: winged helix DNA-binding domain-containing protein [Caldiserica bacterium]|nr:winged helix DNA-binding domain-containing protein [Caldisericota bacterium]
MKPAALQITARQARAFALARGGISQPFAEPVAAVRAMIAVQAQYATSVPFAIHARCPSAPNGWTEQALMTQRSLVKTWCLRGTLHALAADDLALLTGAFTGYHHSVERVVQQMSGIDAATWHAIERDTMQALVHGPLDRTALHAAVPGLRNVPWIGWGEDVKDLAYQGELLMVGSKGPRPVFARRDTWLPRLDFHPMSTAAAHKELLMRYLRAFAPAALADITHWSGLPNAALRDVMRSSPSLFVTVTMNETERPLVALAEDVDALTGPLPDVPQVTLLPKFDALMLAWIDPSRVLDRKDHPAVYRPAGQIEAVVLLRGRAAATWRVKQTPDRTHITVTPIRHISTRARKQVTTEFERLGAWSGASSTTVAWQD